MKALILSAIMTLGLTQLVLAQSQEITAKRDDAIEKREVNQQQRIENGVKSGQLSQQEVQKLEEQQARLKANEAKAMEDGKVTKKEARKLERQANRASKNIFKKKHNKQNAG